MINKEIKEKIKREAMEFFKNASGCHDWSHIERVHKLALKIGKAESADLNIIELAVFLHDIGRKEEFRQKGAFCHAEKGADLARKILKKYNFKKDFIEAVVHCVAVHRFRKGGAPESLEAKVLFDADKLDSIGAVGIARDFLFAGGSGSNCLYTGREKELAKSDKDYSFTKEDSAFLEYELKLKKIKDKMLTKKGKEMARKRHQFMEDYFRQFWKEVAGKV